MPLPTLLALSSSARLFGLLFGASAPGDEDVDPGDDGSNGDEDEEDDEGGDDDDGSEVDEPIDSDDDEGGGDEDRDTEAVVAGADVMGRVGVVDDGATTCGVTSEASGVADDDDDNDDGGAGPLCGARER